MKTFARFGMATIVAMSGTAALAQATQDHTQHHPAGAPPATVSPAPAPSAVPPADRMGAMDRQMAEMKAMREKLARAQTPQELQALMAEHMKVMSAGMNMMSMGAGQAGVAPQMSSGMSTMPGGMMGEMAQRHQMMEKRMEMMETMMRMMMDRMQ